MNITIDSNSGFCAGVTGAIRKAEEELLQGPLYCLGDIVHNSEEVARLEALGLETIDYDDLRTLRGGRVLLRAHGEQPATYRIASDNLITLYDATCPVVKKLQERIRDTWQAHPDAQIVIFGKVGHAEVVGLQGQTNNTAIVIEHEADLQRIDYSKPIYLFSQTTKSEDEFHHIAELITKRSLHPEAVECYDTICRNVANRVSKIKEFAAGQDMVIFVGGSKSSNAKVLFEHCREANSKTFFISSPDQLPELLDTLHLPLKDSDRMNIGICGATSTPSWLMQNVKERLESLIGSR